MAGAQGLVNTRSRVTFFLPVEKPAEAKAAFEIARYLQKLRGAQIQVTGFTRSGISPAYFTGAWYSTDQSSWIVEPVAQFIIDYDSSANDKLHRTLDRLHSKMRSLYESSGSKQEAFWIVVHPVTRFVPSDET